MTDLVLLDTAVRMVKREGPWEVALMPSCVQTTDMVSSGELCWWTAKNGMSVSRDTIDAIRAAYVQVNRLP